MAKAWLRDDHLAPHLDPPVRVGTRLTEDAPTETFEVLPTLTVRQRERIGFDDDGDPVFVWSVLVEDTAVLWEEREEIDDISGATRIKAKATVLYDGGKEMTESAVVSSSSGGRFRVTSVAQVPDHLKMELERVDG